MTVKDLITALLEYPMSAHIEVRNPASDYDSLEGVILSENYENLIYLSTDEEQI